jgi:hypothetical protein
MFQVIYSNKFDFEEVEQIYCWIHNMFILIDSYELV